MLHLRKGATLVELLISIAILGVVMVPISTVLYSGFSNYYVESDILIATQKAREVMDMIVEDIRMNDNPDISIEDSGKTLNIVKDDPVKEDIVYKLGTISGNQTLIRNAETVFKPEDNIILMDFSVQNEKPLGYDSHIIKITLGIKVGKSDTVMLQSSYRRKTG